MKLPSSPTIDRVLAAELCSGCGMCAGIATDSIRMETVAPGYSRPNVFAALDSSAENRIAAACPGAVVAPWPDAPERDSYWGPSIRILAGHATDPHVRFAGSSGGALSALLIHALATGLVDRVLHVAPDPEYPTRSRLQVSKTAEEVIANAGSRYSASSPLQDIDRVLAEDMRTAFVGKPCDVSALRQLATADPRVAQRIPITLSFFCGGLPSHAGADRIVRQMGLDPARLARFRYRGNGWPGQARAETVDGQVREMSYAESWGNHLSKEVQFRCKICPDAVGGVADIACADAWHGDADGYPSFEEQDGRSLIVTRTAPGDALFASAAVAGVLEASPIPVRDIDLMQPAQARRKRLIVARVASCRLAGHAVPKMDGLDVKKAARKANLREQSRNFLGMLRRIIFKRK
ncbi:Coenzyme F420 hydrogenase/dehydrogenase, beta subunit C-terminal domain [Novosphingobium album (ex Hu et al. 2023)]|uniref:Coenzyme F420 hydrogenase/dehydrogenase, beta subunit C-terminal domain n=1 Tax=Novosphingobium album (ex Hu et al. 2023) TaxID=2930093 RepID=A0ABT0B4T0_9SPHN|nr:Coenzyme F420 hydrogenase/dehydrogenase, beta subunit C-terminal domain [Novosphingobium album (ex Hu et al. 2023)]MCJ2180047.1 Coenzyme F420 hydrogenase/dehydrogenase, beta subunit C-terminal domain [Novosphingobium album (ex Hu et al. 2023)]